MPLASRTRRRWALIRVGGHGGWRWLRFRPARRTFRAGVHHTEAALALTGTLTLDGESNPDAVFIFQVDAALNTAASSNITLINGAQASNVYWQVLGAAGTGAGSRFVGTILAAGGITLGNGTTLIGRALSKGGVSTSDTTVRFTP